MTTNARRRVAGRRPSGAARATSRQAGATRPRPRWCQASAAAPAVAHASASVETRSGTPFERSRSKRLWKSRSPSTTTRCTIDCSTATPTIPTATRRERAARRARQVAPHPRSQRSEPDAPRSLGCRDARRASCPRVLSAAAVLAYGWFEAGLAPEARARGLDPGLPAPLDGVRIGHLSDFHLGARFSPRQTARASAPPRGPRIETRTPRLRHRRSCVPPRGEASPAGCSHGSTGRTSCWGTTTLQSRGTRSHAPRSSTTSSARGCCATRRRRSTGGERVSSWASIRRRTGRNRTPPRPRGPRRPPAAPALPLPGHRPHAARRVVRPHPRRPPPRRADLHPLAGPSHHARRIHARARSPASTRPTPASCTCRLEPGRPSSRSGSSRARR